MAKVYVKTDGSARVVAVNSDVFLTDLTGWTQVDEGEGDMFAHAQSMYLPGALMDIQGRYRYKLVGGEVVERTTEELAADLPLARESKFFVVTYEGGVTLVDSMFEPNASIVYVIPGSVVGDVLFNTLGAGMYLRVATADTWDRVGSMEPANSQSSTSVSHPLTANQGRLLKESLAGKLPIPTLLYTNPSPAAAFAAQTLALTLTNYDSVLIEFYTNVNLYAYLKHVYVRIGKAELPNGYVLNGSVAAREVSAATGGVTFGECYLRADGAAGAGEVNNAYMVPYRIYGVAQSAQAAAQSAAVYDTLAGTVAEHTAQLADVESKALETTLSKHVLLKEAGWYYIETGELFTNTSYTSTKKARLCAGQQYKVITDETVVGYVFFDNNGFVTGIYTDNKTFTMPTNATIVAVDMVYSANFVSLGIVDVTDINELKQAVEDNIDDIIANSSDMRLVDTFLSPAIQQDFWNNRPSSNLSEAVGKSYNFEVHGDIDASSAVIYFYDATVTPSIVYSGAINQSPFVINVVMPIDNAVGYGIRFVTYTKAENVSIILSRAINDNNLVNCFGDSITQSVRASSAENRYPNLLQVLLGNKYTVNNFGVSGAMTTNIAARMGGIAALLSNDITFEPDVVKKTWVNPTESSLFKSTYLLDTPYDMNLINPAGYPDFNPCYIDGKLCMMTVTESGGDATLDLQLLDPNSEGTILHQDSPVYFHGTKDAQNGINIIMMGTNGSYQGSTNAEKAIDYTAQYKKCAEFIGSGKYLMLSQFNFHVSGATYEQYKASQNTALLMEIEKRMRYEFGQKFVNMRQELINHGLRYAIDGGYLTEDALTDANNLECISLGIVPPSLLYSDFVHPCDAGNYAMAYIVFMATKSIGY